MKIATIKGGATFSKAGVAKKLDKTVEWGASAAFVDRDTQQERHALTVTFAKSSDWATTGNWDIALYLPGATTKLMEHATKPTRVWNMDVKFFDTQNPDPVLFTETVEFAVERSVT